MNAIILYEYDIYESLPVSVEDTMTLKDTAVTIATLQRLWLISALVFITTTFKS